MRGTFRELANAGEIPEPHTPLIPLSEARCTVQMASCDLGPCTDGFRIALKRNDAMKETLAKEFPTPARPTGGSAPQARVRGT